MSAKLKLVRSFKSMIKYLPQLVSLTTSLSELRGFQSKSKHAEAFICYPIVQSAEEIRNTFSNKLIVDFEKEPTDLLESD